MPKTKTFYCFKAVSDTETDILIYGVIGPDFWEEGNLAKKFVSDFKAAEEKYKRINIRINSPGGYISEGLPMFNAISQSKSEVHTYNDGIAYSMGAIILLAAKKENIHASKESLTLLHTPLSIGIGNARDLRSVANDLDKYGDILISAVSKNTGIDEKEIKDKWFDYEDHLMTAVEAKDFGLIGDVIEEKAKVPSNITNLSYRDVLNIYNTGFAEDSLLDKFTSSVKDMFNEFLPKNTIKAMKKKFLNLTTFFGFDIESVDGKLTITDEQLEKMDNLTKTVSDTKAALEKAVTDAKTAGEKATTDLNAANEKITALEEEIAELRKTAGAKPATVKSDTESGAEEEGSAITFDMPLAERMAKMQKAQKK